MKRTVAFYAAAIAFSVFCTPALGAPVVIKGPYAQNVSETEATIMYQTSESAEITLNFGYTPAADSQKKVSIGTMHEVLLNNLQAGKRLYYRIEGASAKSNPYAEGGINSLSGSVQLPPFPRKYVFAVVGDTRSGHLEHSAISARISAAQPMFVVNTGDLVSDGTVEADWQTFFDIEHDLMASTVILPALGNHDVDSGKADLYFKYFSVPKDYTDTEAYYKVRYGNIQFMVLDSEINFSFLGFSITQGNWIRNTLDFIKDNAQIEHRFLALHEGPYASDPGRSGNAAIRTLMGDFKTWKVDAIFSGHDHNYERGLSNNSIAYIVTGGGGASLYDVGSIGTRTTPPHEVRANKKDYNFILVTIHGPWAKMDAVDKNGALIDTWEYGEEPVDECLEDVGCDGITKSHDPCGGKWKCQSYTCNWICNALDGGAVDSGVKDGGAKDSGTPVGDASQDAAAADSGASSDAAPLEDAGQADSGILPDQDSGGSDGGGEPGSNGCSCSAVGI
jgi:hypothetical protein